MPRGKHMLHDDELSACLLILTPLTDQRSPNLYIRAARMDTDADMRRSESHTQTFGTSPF
jgi:hypothetical protein